MDTNVHETLLQAGGSSISELRMRETDSIPNSVQDIDEREERRFRKLENRRSDNNENQFRTCFRATRSYSIWSSQFHNERRYSGWPMRSDHSNVSNERWSRGNNRWENSNWLSRYRNGYVPNTDWSGENSRWSTYMSYRVLDSSWTHRYNREGGHGSYRVEDTTRSNECGRNGRYGSIATCSIDWYRQQIYRSHRTKDPIWPKSCGNYRNEYMIWHNERNRQGRYGSCNVEYMTLSDGHHRQGRYGSLRIHRPGWASAHYRQGRTFSNRGENMNLSILSFRGCRHWNDIYPIRRRVGSYNERCVAMLLMKDKENVESAAMVSLPSAKTSNIALNLHEHRNVVYKSQFSSRQPFSGEAASKSIHTGNPISNGSVHSDLTTTVDTSSEKIGSGCCNIEGKSEVEAESSSELGSSDCKTVSSFLKEEMSVIDERLENEQRQALEMCISQSMEDNNVPLFGSCSQKNPCAALEADIYSCMADNPMDVLCPFPERPLAINSRKKLLILDINGLLADIISPPPKECKPDTCILRRFSRDHSAMIFLRSVLRGFMWAFGLQEQTVTECTIDSLSRKIIDRVIDYLLGSLKRKLVLCWDLSHCTPTKFKTLENKHKGVVFKELKKIWKPDDPSLPWKEGEYNASNTLLLDDSPYKALLNPMHSAIFPKSYSFKDTDDNSLGPNGDLRVYLEKLAAVDDIQKYVEQQPLGQNAIDETDCNWSFYSEVVSSVAHPPQMSVNPPPLHARLLT